MTHGRDTAHGAAVLADQLHRRGLVAHALEQRGGQPQHFVFGAGLGSRQRFERPARARHVAHPEQRDGCAEPLGLVNRMRREAQRGLGARVPHRRERVLEVFGGQRAEPRGRELRVVAQRPVPNDARVGGDGVGAQAEIVQRAREPVGRAPLHAFAVGGSGGAGQRSCQVTSGGGEVATRAGLERQLHQRALHHVTARVARGQLAQARAKRLGAALLEVQHRRSVARVVGQAVRRGLPLERLELRDGRRRITERRVGATRVVATPGHVLGIAAVLGHPHQVQGSGAAVTRPHQRTAGLEARFAAHGAFARGLLGDGFELPGRVHEAQRACVGGGLLQAVGQRHGREPRALLALRQGAEDGGHPRETLRGQRGARGARGDAPQQRDGLGLAGHVGARGEQVDERQAGADGGHVGGSGRHDLAVARDGFVVAAERREGARFGHARGPGPAPVPGQRAGEAHGARGVAGGHALGQLQRRVGRERVTRGRQRREVRRSSGSIAEPFTGHRREPAQLGHLVGIGRVAQRGLGQLPRCRVVTPGEGSAHLRHRGPGCRDCRVRREAARCEDGRLSGCLGRGLRAHRRRGPEERGSRHRRPEQAAERRAKPRNHRYKLVNWRKIAKSRPQGRPKAC